MLFMSNSEQTNKKNTYANKTRKYESQVLPQHVNTYCITIAIEIYECNKIWK